MAGEIILPSGEKVGNNNNGGSGEVPLPVDIVDFSDTIKGEDKDGNAQGIGVGGVENNELRVQDSFSHLLKEILVELKINNEYLFQITGDKVTESDIEIK